MPKHKDQRVGVFIDVQNLYYSAKQFYNSKVNFAHILSRATSGRSLIRAIAYVIKADIKEESNFFEALEKIGFDVRAKDLQTFYGGAKKGDWDVGIAMDIMRMASKLDVIVLVSGDGDFKDLLEHVKALGCRAEVIAFGKTSSSRLLAEADEFIDLGKELDKVLIKRDGRYNKPQSPGNGQSRPPARTSRPPVRSSGPPVGKKPMFNKNRPRPSSSNRPRMGKRFENRPREEPSLIQKLNMEQPELNTEAPKKIEMPKPEQKAVKRPVKKTVKKKATKKPATAKKTVKKAAPKKKESMVKKVLKKMTKKK